MAMSGTFVLVVYSVSGFVTGLGGVSRQHVVNGRRRPPLTPDVGGNLRQVMGDI